MNDKDLNIENQDIENENNDYETEYIDSSSEEMLGNIAVQEELKRIDIQDNPKSKVPKDVKSSELYKELTSQAHIIGDCLQILLGYGCDYNNALAISTSFITNKSSLELTKASSAKIEQQQL